MWVSSRTVRNSPVSTPGRGQRPRSGWRRRLSGEDRFMKRIALLVVALCAFAVAVPVAQTAPTSDSGCTVEHLSGAECQGPDVNTATDSCEIATWVGNASCDLTVSDGVANSAEGFLNVFATLQDTNNWHTEFHLVVRDKSTGEVL